MMRWFDAQGGHLETKGISPDGKVISVPLHRHHVKLNIFRVDASLKYQFNLNWGVEVNIPYEMKVQEATLEEIDPLTALEREAILRNRDIHHRNETYTGLTDSDFFIGYRRQSILKTNDLIIGRVGTTLPLGKTEEDPWKLGDAGLEHLHIQFGTGTFNPIADVHYSLPLFAGISVNGSVRGKFPFYENSKTYRGSTELTYSAGMSYRLRDWLSLQAGYLGVYQGYAYWAGERDINTGMRFSMLSFGTSVVMPYDVPLSLAVMLPLGQEMFHTDSGAGAYEEMDAFEFGPLVSLTVLYGF